MNHTTLDVIIPIYKPDKKFDKLLTMLLNQTIRPKRIILMNTEVFPEYSNSFVTERIQKLCRLQKVVGSDSIEIKVVSVAQEEFDHGKTRDLGTHYSDSDIIVFMTQDAIPKDTKLLKELISPLQNKQVVVAYARQEASMDAGLIEQYTRIFNYPNEDSIKSKEDKERLGIKTYFCSNVCAAYKRELYDELGGFVKKTIFNEDMIFAAKAVEAGYSIAYASKAKVIHSHNYTLMQQLRRNFDLGVSQRQYKEIFEELPSEKEGMKLVKQTLGYFVGQRHYWEVFAFIMESGFKYIGYFLGKRYTYLPQSLCQSLSMNKAYWRKYV